ncbi:amidohydrolase family protein [Micromonospora inyonensis]|uniref:2-polyprenyl-6-methoxyphenol hydroxylase n=1 Tax=Micromonospora inyonensis TaxID=47866 RepID=A0A1C6RJV4_9ACTN|nr:amidohydrolase family protein [Micromonospora inyonensis]SCL17461.1 hypothetical protein GA0074694_2012 [Micromonospora inyonensis]
MYDAIVVGARCAGASTALLLARRGHRVLVVDRSSIPSDVISTHFLWPHGMSYLNRWGVLDQVKAVTPTYTAIELVNDGIRLTGSVPPELLREYFRDLHGDDSGVVQSYASVRRRVLDQILVEAAAKAGAEVRTGFSVRELIIEDGRVVGVRGRSVDGQTVEERARVVIGADGRNSFVARTLGLPKFDERPRCTFAYWSYFSGFDPGPGQIHRRGRLACAVVPTNFEQNMVLVWGPSDWSREFRADVPGNFQKALDFVSPELGELVRSRGVQEERFYGAAHAIGDAANRMVLRAYARWQETACTDPAAAGAVPRLRHRIEHTQHLRPADVPLLARLGVTASMQPTHCTSDIPLTSRMLAGRDLASYAWRSLLDTGATVAFGSDAPVEDPDPFYGIHAAVTRQQPDGTPPGGVDPHERLDLDAALHGFTAAGAYASYEEHLKGRLRPGMLADFIALPADPYQVEPADLRDLTVALTVVGGVVRWQR